MKIWIDFVCPYCFLAEKPLQEATRGLDVEVEWMPFELRPHPNPTLRPEDEYLPSVWKRSVYPLAAQLGIDIKLPAVSPQPYSRLALEGMQFAKEHGKVTEYVDATFRAFFQRGLDIGSLDVLRDIAREVGLEENEFVSALQSGKYTGKHQQALLQARQLGIHVVPTIQVDGERIEGMPRSSVLRDLLARKVREAG
jgi:predicted DsbA family dithiol-disulfide isomerase